MPTDRRPALLHVVLAGAVLVHCDSGPAPADDEGGACFPDSDGISGGDYVFDVTVDDTGFSKLILASQNDAQVTLTLTNTGTTPHGFTVGCIQASAPAGCPTTVCFPPGATISPLAPGASQTVVFVTPTPDGVIYRFRSNALGESAVSGLNEGQWSMM